MTNFSDPPLSSAQSGDFELSRASSQDMIGMATVRIVESESKEKSKPMEVIDMRGEEIEHVEASLKSLVGESFVMHGGNGSAHLIEEFDPVKSSLADKKPSVYATDDPETAIFNALLKKHGPRATALRILDGGFGASSNMLIHDPSRTKFVVPQHTADAIKEALALGEDSEEWRSLFSEGAVYLMPKNKFSMASPRIDGVDEHTDHEWNTQEKVPSVYAVVISPKLITDVLRFEGAGANVDILPVDDKLILDQFREGMAEAIPEGVNEFSAAQLREIANGDEERLKFAELLEGEVGSVSLPKSEFVEKAADIYKKMIVAQSRV